MKRVLQDDCPEDCFGELCNDEKLREVISRNSALYAVFAAFLLIGFLLGLVVANCRRSKEKANLSAGVSNKTMVNKMKRMRTYKKQYTVDDIRDPGEEAPDKRVSLTVPKMQESEVSQLQSQMRIGSSEQLVEDEDQVIEEGDADAVDDVSVGRIVNVANGRSSRGQWRSAVGGLFGSVPSFGGFKSKRGPIVDQVKRMKKEQDEINDEV